MIYFITFIREDEFEWCVFNTHNKEYAYKTFEDLFSPPEYDMELRVTNEPIETFRNYDVLMSKKGARL